MYNSTTELKVSYLDEDGNTISFPAVREDGRLDIPALVRALECKGIPDEDQKHLLKMALRELISLNAPEEYRRLREEVQRQDRKIAFLEQELNSLRVRKAFRKGDKRGRRDTIRRNDYQVLADELKCTHDQLYDGLTDAEVAGAEQVAAMNAQACAEAK